MIIFKNNFQKKLIKILNHVISVKNIRFKLFLCHVVMLFCVKNAIKNLTRKSASVANK